MQAVSSVYATNYAGVHDYSSKVQILKDGAAILDSSTSTTLNVISGTVRADATAAWRRSLSELVIVDTTGSLIPLVSTDTLSVTGGNEVQVYAGIEGELFSQGIFDIASCVIDDAIDGFTITLSGHDRARRVSRNKFIKEFIIANDTNAVTAAQNILNDRFPTIQYSSVASTTFKIPYQVIPPQADPWEEMLKILDSIGFEAFFDVQGRCVIRAVPDPAVSAPVISWQYAEGSTSTLLKTSRSKSNEEVFNYVEVTGESTYNITPAKGVAFDNDPSSATYAGDPTVSPVVAPGPYGVVPAFFQDNKVQTQAQANAAAAAKLLKVKGGTEVTEFSVIPNPAQEPGDYVTITRARSKLSAATVYIDAFDIPLTASGGPEMAITTRKRAS